MSTRNAVAGLALLMGLASPGAALAEELTVWSHWADQEAKVKFLESAARAFEQAHPGVTVKFVWYQKEPLDAALKTALTAGQGPDIFYAEPNQTEYIDSGLVLDLSNKIDWSKLEPWAAKVWSHDKGVYGFPLEAWTVETYINSKLMKKAGVEMPVEGLVGEAFVDAVKQIKTAGITPMAQGTGDRPFTGAFLTHEILVKKLGVRDYESLLRGGDVKWTDPRVREALGYAEEIIAAGAFPKSISSLKLGEAHRYFHTSPGAAMFQTGAFYPSRAFAPPDAGGQPVDFELAITNGPIPEGAACPKCKTIAVGGSFVVNAASKHLDLAVAFLNSMATEEMANKWLETSLVQTGIKSDPSKIEGENAGYFRKLAAVNEGVTYTFGTPVQQMRGTPREVFIQTVSQAFPAGLIGVDEVVEMMDGAR